MGSTMRQVLQRTLLRLVASIYRPNYNVHSVKSVRSRRYGWEPFFSGGGEVRVKIKFYDALIFTPPFEIKLIVNAI